MRSVLLVLATLVLIVCGFVIYSQMQGPNTSPRADKTAAPRPATRPLRGGAASTSQRIVGAGSDVWVERYHPRTGELSSKFRAARYDPQPDDTVLVDRPVAEFILGRGRFVRIEGRRGSVIMPAPKVAERGEIQPPPAQPPNRGQLHEVVISLFDTEPLDGQPHEPSMTVTMNNASFDNDTFLIRTDAYTDEGGNRVEADQVPVKVRGVDYDFDGRGLTIRWNDLDRRLQLMEIAHGESLTVKNPRQLEALREGDAQPAPDASVKPTGEAAATAPPSASRAKGRKRKPADAATAPTAPTTSRAAATYRASFERDLRIAQGDAEVAAGELMQVDFVMQGGNEDVHPAAASADEAAAVGRKRARRASTTAAATPAPATMQARTPAMQDTEDQPIVVRWSGRLRVLPLELSNEPALPPAEQVVRLSGTPLRLRHGGADITAAGATYRTSDGSMNLRSSDEVPRITLRNAKGAVVNTPAIVYAQDAGTATLTGPSSAEIPMGDSGETLSATWNEQCVLSLPENQAGEADIRGAKITGAVAIAHPRMDLNSDELDLSFAPPAVQNHEDEQSAPNLEKLIASGSVQARLKDPSGPPQAIQARRLELDTAAAPGGQLLPRTLVADGEVLLSDPTQSLRAEHVEAKLAPKPTTAPAAAPATAPATTRASSDMPEMIVESLVAQGGVRLTGQKGALATAEQLHAIEKDGQSLVKLMGVPTAPATVSDGKNTITGNILTLFPRDQKAEVPGPGTLTFVREGKSGTTSSPPVHVAWTGHAALDGGANRVDLHEGVSFKTVDEQGMTTISTSNHLELMLADKPTTQPATAPATRPAGGGLGDLRGTDFLANKEPQSAKLSGDVRIESVLLGNDQAVLRRTYLRADQADYDVTARQMVVPVNGRLLYEDHRPPQEPKPGEEPDNANRGRTAFEWKKRLTYDDAAERAVMEGDVDIMHEPDDPKNQSFRIATQRVVADLEARPAEAATPPATAPATPPATNPSGPLPTSLRLKRVTAEGGVSVTAKRFQFTATTLSYTPADGVLTARGSAEESMTFTDEQGQGEGSVESLTWNTKTDQISLKRGRGRVRP